MARSTSYRTWATPKLLLIPRSSRMGVSLMVSLPNYRIRDGGGSVRCGPPGSSGGPHPRQSADACVSAQLGEVAGAQVGRLHVTCIDDGLDVRLVDRDRIKEHGRDVAVARVIPGGPCGRGLVALHHGDRSLSQRAGLSGGGLLDRHALRAGEDVLQTLHRGVLTRDGDLAGLTVLLEDRDDATGETVVGGVDAVDLAVDLGVELLEDRDGLVVVPVGDGLLSDVLVGRDLVEHAVRTLREQRGVVVGRRAV